MNHTNAEVEEIKSTFTSFSFYCGLCDYMFSKTVIVTSHHLILQSNVQYLSEIFQYL